MATRNIDVSLNKPGNPAVVLSSRSVQAVSGDTIKWKKKDNNDQFDISSLSPTGAGTAFGAGTVGGGGNNLSAAYQPTSNEPSALFDYTLTVTSDGQTYNTTESSNQPDEGRPVIRN